MVVADDFAVEDLEEPSLNHPARRTVGFSPIHALARRDASRQIGCLCSVGG